MSFRAALARNLALENRDFGYGYIASRLEMTTK